MNTDRTQRQRERTLKRQQILSASGRRFPLTDHRALAASQKIASWQLRVGMRNRERLNALPFAIDPDEMLAGRIDFEHITYTDAEFAEFQAFMKDYPGAPGQTGHCELDLQPLFELGIDGLIASLEARKKTASGETVDTYQSFILALDGMRLMIAHAADTVEAARSGANDARQAELDAIAAACRRVAHQPPQTFREAIQLLWFTMLAVMVGDTVGLVDPGRLDRTLIPYYQPAEKAEALELIEALYLQINDFQEAGLAYGVMVGGQDEHGRDVTNDLSYLGLEAIRRTGLTYPTVGVCWHPGTPSELSALAVDLISHGYATPAFFDDNVIARGLVHYGVPEKDSHSYINSTCVEITPRGCSNVWVASPYFSLCGTLLEEIDAECAAPAPTFDAFLERYYARLEKQIADAVADQNRQREERRRIGRKPLQSVFTNDCIARGKDIDDGGARYNWVECSFVGLANLTDSLVVIREELYGAPKMTFSALKKILDSNFEADPNFHQKVMRHYPKYGHAAAAADALIPPLLARIQTACAKGKMLPDDSPFVPGTFCWIMHQWLGSQCGATPDGRLKGFAFADGCGPAQGREIYGPTAGICSVTSWDHHRMIGGTAYNMKFSKKLFDSPSSRNKLQALVETFLKQGGFETQINVVDQQTLLDAQKNPDAYRDLVVRIGGYTDYFTHLSPGMQAEVIQRTSF